MHVEMLAHPLSKMNIDLHAKQVTQTIIFVCIMLTSMFIRLFNVHDLKDESFPSVFHDRYITVSSFVSWQVYT